MKFHANAKLSPKGLLAVVSSSSRAGLVAHAGGRGRRSQRAQLLAPGSGRYRAERESGLIDRSSAPRRSLNRTVEARSSRSLRSGGCG